VLRALVSAHLSAARVAWPGTAGSGNSADGALSATQQIIDAFAEGDERAPRLAVRQEEAARREFIDDLLYGRSDLGRLAERAERFGLRLSPAHTVAVAQSPAAYEEADPVPRRVEQALITRFGKRDVLLTTKDGLLLCVAPGHEDKILPYFAQQGHTATDGGRVASAAPQPGPGGVVQPYVEVLNALELAERLELDDPVLRAADLLVHPVHGRPTWRIRPWSWSWPVPPVPSPARIRPRSGRRPTAPR
jgi:hypothetical protein